MRKASLLSLVLAGACGTAPDAAVGETALIPDFASFARLLPCDRPLPAPGRGIEHLVAASDSTFLALYAAERRVALHGADLRPRWSFTFDEDGPRGVLRPRAVALLGDTLVYVADLARSTLKAFTPSGEIRPGVALPSPPQAVAVAGSRLLVAPFAAAPDLTSLLFEVAGARVRTLRVPLWRHVDPRWQALGNSVGLLGYGDGRAVLVHRMLVPRGYAVSSRAGEAPAPFPLPLPEAVRAQVGRLPREVTRATAGDVLVPALAAAAGPGGSLFYLTRSGERLGTHAEKAIVAVDGSFRLRAAYRVQPNAVQLAYLASERIFLLVDDQERWYRCPLPAGAA